MAGKDPPFGQVDIFQTRPNLTVEFEKEIHKQIEKANPNLDSFTCPYIKRRKISVIRVLNAEAQ